MSGLKQRASILRAAANAAELCVLKILIGLCLFLTLIPSPAKAQLACNASTEAVMIYDAGALQYCNGTNWIAISRRSMAGMWPPGDSESDLVSHWAFNETGNISTAADAEGPNTGNLVNFNADPSASWIASGNIDGALEFDGADDYVNAGTFNISGDEITLAAWVRIDSFIDDDPRIITRRDGGNMLWSLDTENTTSQFKFRTMDALTDILGGEITFGVWTHIVGVYDGATMKLYQDGYEVASAPQTGNLPTSGAGLVGIGGDGTGNRDLDGAIDDLRVYNRALSHEDIVTLYAEGGGTPPPIQTADGYFVEIAVPDANLGGLSGADALCLSELTGNGWLGKSDAQTNSQLQAATVKAWLCSDSACQNLQPNARYKYASVVNDTAGGASFISTQDGFTADDGLAYDNAGAFGISGFHEYYTGRSQTNTPQASTCGNWSTATGSTDIAVSDTNAYSEKLSKYPINCNEPAHIMCLVAPIITGGSVEGNCTTPDGAAGTIIYNEDENRLQLCDGANWIGLGEKFTGGGGVTGLLAHWTMNNTGGSNVTNVLGSNNGNWQDATDDAITTESVPGQHGNALSFNRADDSHVRLTPDSSLTNLGAMTVCGWFNAGSLDTNTVPLVTKQNASNGAGSWSLYANTAGGDVYGFKSRMNDWKESEIGNPSITYGSWQHVCATWNGTDGLAGIQLYIDGIADSNAGQTGTGGGTVNDAGFDLLMGGDLWNGSFISTIMDDVRIYDRVLGPAEIASVMANSDCTDPEGVAGTIVYNDDPYNVMQYCNGNQWIALGPVTGTAPAPPSDTAPDAFNFADVIDAALSTPTASATVVTISGIDTPASVSISGSGSPQYRIDGGSWTSAPGTISNGQTLEVRLTSSASNGTALTATVNVGGVTDDFTITTEAGSGAPTSGLVHHWKMDDAASGPYLDSVGSANCTVSGSPTSIGGKDGTAIQFASSTDADCGVITAMQNVSQFTLSAWIKRASAGAQFTLGPYASSSDSIGLQPWSDGNTYFMLCDSGSGWEEGWTPLSDTNWHLLTLVYDGTLTGNANRMKAYIDGSPVTLDGISGSIEATTPASIPSFTFSNNQAGSVDDVRVYNRPLTAPEVLQLYNATNGTVSDTTPDAFNFVDATGAALSTATPSPTTVTVAGINAATAISISGSGSPQYRINGGSWTSSAGTVNNGDTVEARLTSSSSNNTGLTATVTIGGVTDDFTVTTESGPFWILSSMGQSCDSACTSFGGCNLTATRDYAGSAGTDGNCTSVIASLGHGGNTLTSSGSAYDIGCSIQGGPYTNRYSSVTTTCSGSVSNRFRACACNNSGGTDTTPDAFSFPDIADAALGTQTFSASITITGIDTLTPVSISGPTTSRLHIGGGTSGSHGISSGYITNGQTIRVSIVSSGTANTPVVATINIGGVTTNWIVTTGTPSTGGHNWILGSLGQSCDAACTSYGGCNLTATRDFVGSSGTDINCQSVMISLGRTGNTFLTYPVSSSSGIGCSAESSPYLRRVPAPTTTCAATVANRHRACACNNSTVPDSTPDAFNFADVTGAALSTVTASPTTVTVAGINTAAAISISGSGSPQYRINGGAWTSTAGTVNNGDTVEARLTSSASHSTGLTATINIGGVTDNWTVTTLAGAPACPATPVDPTDIGCAMPGGEIFAGDTNMYVTDVMQGTGIQWSTENINTGADSATDGAANQAWIVANTTLSNYPAFQTCENLNRHGHTDWYLPARAEILHLYTNMDDIGVFYTSSYWSSTEASNTEARFKSFSYSYEDYGNKSNGMRVHCIRREIAPDTTPDAFNFADVTGAALSTATPSPTTVTVAGINTATAISISGSGSPQYRINGGSWTSTAGTVNNGDTVEARLTSSSSNATGLTATVTIGGVTDNFTVTTVAGPTCSSAGGVTVGGACWFYGALGQSCTTVCTGVGGTYDTATQTYAGNPTGTNTNCNNVLNALNVLMGQSTQSDPDSETTNLGCCTYEAGSERLRGTAGTTTAGGSRSWANRACACTF